MPDSPTTPLAFGPYDPRTAHLRTAGELARQRLREGATGHAPTRDQLHHLLGLSGMRELRDKQPVPSHATVWTRPFDFGTVERIEFEPEPDVKAPVYIATPKRGQPPYPVVICLQGHNSGMHLSLGLDRSGARPIETERDRDIGLQALQHGYAAVCLEQRCFGERAISDRRFDSMCHEAAATALTVGRCLVGDRVLDVARLLDLLSNRPNLDTRAPGVIGNSAGGTTAYYALASLPELGWGIPSCCFGPIAHTRMQGHFCTCTYVPNHLVLCDMPDLAGLIAPRPLALVSGRRDGGFPPDAVRSGFETVLAHYRRAGADRRCELVLASEGHRWYARLAWEAAGRVIVSHGCDSPQA